MELRLYGPLAEGGGQGSLHPRLPSPKWLGGHRSCAAEIDEGIARHLPENIPGADRQGPRHPLVQYLARTALRSPEPGLLNREPFGFCLWGATKEGCLKTPRLSLGATNWTMEERGLRLMSRVA